MRTYYIDYPRDFANEYTVYVVESDIVERFEACHPNADRISRQRAIDRGWTRPREAQRAGEQWFGGFFQTVEPRDHTQAAYLDACAESTRLDVDMAEAHSAE